MDVWKGSNRGRHREPFRESPWWLYAGAVLLIIMLIIVVAVVAAIGGFNAG